MMKPLRLCVGGEWHRYPSSFYIPHEKIEVGFLRSDFHGQLPQPFPVRSAIERRSGLCFHSRCAKHEAKIRDAIALRRSSVFQALFGDETLGERYSAARCDLRKESALLCELGRCLYQLSRVTKYVSDWKCILSHVHPAIGVPIGADQMPDPCV